MKIINKVFLLLFSVSWLIVFGIRLFLEKGQFLTFLGLQHAPNWNMFFIISTQFAEELAYATFALVFLFIRYRVSLAIAFTGLGVTIAAGLLKMLFSFERPFLYFKNLGLEGTYSKIEGVAPYTGLTSFPSGHAMAGFALMSLLSIYLRSGLLALVFFLIALLVGVSRIYLGHHFIEDVLFGSLLGVVISYVVYILMEKWKLPMLDQSFLSSKKVKLNA